MTVSGHLYAGVSAASDDRNIKGTVTDSKGEPLGGAAVQIEGTDRYAISDIDGKFSLAAPEKGILTVSFIGFDTQRVTLDLRDNYTVILQEDTKLLEEVVVVGYGTQRKDNLTGSVASVKTDKLTVAPITNVTNALGGQLPGLKTKQISGIPGSDGAQLSIRGFNTPLIIVDGVETSFSNVDPSQIESISVLKDGAASIYGARAGNGVILVTLKRGKEQKVTISLNASATMQNSTRLIRSGSSGQRAEWEREAHINAGKPASQIPWKMSDIQKFYDGGNPDYLNTDWFSAAIRDWAPQQNHNISISGGTDKIKFYTYLGYNNQQTIARKDGGAYDRFNIQTAVDATIFKGLVLSTNLNYIMEDRDFTSMNLSHSNYWFALYDSDPRYPLTLPDETKLSYAGSSFGNAVYASSRKLAGYSRNVAQSFRGNAALTYNFQKVKGLQLKAFINLNVDAGKSKIFRKQPEFYSYNRGTGTYVFERKAEVPNMLYYESSLSQNLTQQYSISYENTFEDAHHLSVLALHENISYKDENFDTSRGDFTSSEIDQFFAADPTTAANNSYAAEMARASFVGRINYGYKNRYLVETIFRADASSKFPKKGRWGFFPSVSLGWVITQEDFMKNVKSVDFLKLRASYGQAGDDGIGNYQYFAGYSFDMQYILNDKIYQGLYATGLANDKLSWERISIYNVGLDLSFFDKKLYGTIEAFYRLRDGIPGYRTNSLPSTFGKELPLENLNSIDTRGFEVEIGTSGRAHDFSWNVSGNISWARSKWVYYDEPDYTDADQKRINGFSGKWTDERYGYISDGLFTSKEEIANLPYTYVELGGNESLRPGDVKYKDLNGDNKLDWRDQTKIGQGAMPNWMYGVNLALKWKNVDLSALFQGSFGYSSYIDLESAPTTLKFENRWTEEENNKWSLVPRPGSEVTSNWWTSDYRTHDAWYLRLKSLSIGYELGKKALDATKLAKLRFYLAGTNLFTITNLSKYGVDPEAPEGTPAYYYPQQRTISIGLSLTY